MKIHFNHKYNNETCQCAYCRNARQMRELQSQNAMADIERQIEQSRKKRIEFERTERMLKLINGNRSNNI